MTRKKSEVEMSTVDFHPNAECLKEGCFWKSSRPSSVARQDAKDHAFYYEGHPVRVVRQTVSTYFLPPLKEKP